MSSAKRAWLSVVACLVLGSGSVAAEPAPAWGCVGCHGVRGTGAPPIPAIAGRSATDIVGIMRAFAAQERSGTIMGRIAAGYTEAEIVAVAAWFAAQR